MKSAKTHDEQPLIRLPKIVSREEWQRARDQLLIKEKAATKAHDALSAERRRLPMVRIEKDYVFEGPSGKVSLLDLFEGRRQLIIYHFMFAPGSVGGPRRGVRVAPWSSITSARSNTSRAQHVARPGVARPTGRARAYKKRMGWKVPWVSSAGTRFNADFGVSTDDGEPSGTRSAAEGSPQGASGGENETFGLSVFLRDGDTIYHTYFTTDRALEAAVTNFTLLDWTPLGRQDAWEDSPPGWPQSEPYVWWRRHDEY
ncbi:MAG: hypothetical protein QOE70_4712 [Chthoniobacter sp.]|jgi:predicted dithiol-disulfide oxidoreductase (DUF899 family)|nr:hypothetical protein [Chthoniobacter sp.]